RVAAGGGGVCGRGHEGAHRPVGAPARRRAEAAGADETTMTVILGVLALVLLLWLANSYVRSSPQVLAAVLKTAGGIVALAGAAFFGVRGNLAVAIPLGVSGLGLLGWLPFGPAGFGARTQKSSGQVSRVRTAFIEMELDHDTGAMRGQILAGRHAGAF